MLVPNPRGVKKPINFNSRTFCVTRKIEYTSGKITHDIYTLQNFANRVFHLSS